VVIAKKDMSSGLLSDRQQATTHMMGVVNPNRALQMLL